jgi:hypothetical protein
MARAPPTKFRLKGFAQTAGVPTSAETEHVRCDPKMRSRAVRIEIASLIYKSHRTKALPTALGLNCCQVLPDPSIASEETKRDLSDFGCVYQACSRSLAIAISFRRFASLCASDRYALPCPHRNVSHLRASFAHSGETCSIRHTGPPSYSGPSDLRSVGASPSITHT